MIGSVGDSLISTILGSPLPRSSKTGRAETPAPLNDATAPTNLAPTTAPTKPTRTDTAEISTQARQAAAELLPGSQTASQQQQAERSETLAAPAAGQSAFSAELTEEETAQVEKLRARDREVRTHEQAHKSAGGRYAGAISYDYQTGPDGKRYAVGGSVPIDVSPVPNDPEATIQKMDQVQRAALAPAEPSGADRRVAAQASRTRAEARAELAAQRRESTQGNESEASSGAPAAPSVEPGTAATNGTAGGSEATSLIDSITGAAPTESPEEASAAGSLSTTPESSPPNGGELDRRSEESQPLAALFQAPQISAGGLLDVRG